MQGTVHDDNVVRFPLPPWCSKSVDCHYEEFHQLIQSKVKLDAVFNFEVDFVVSDYDDEGTFLRLLGVMVSWNEYKVNCCCLLHVPCSIGVTRLNRWRYSYKLTAVVPLLP